MGAIYKVRHRLLDEIRVIKVMRPHTVADADLKRRFIEEAKTATRLKHPNLCTIHDFAVEDNGTGYLVMEFIDGVPVGDLLKQGDLPNFTLTLEIAHQALLALSYLHKKSIVHRDIAPDNLMLLYEDDKPKIKLIDLGIAKAMDKPADQSKTVAGTFLGKLGYASPELFGALGLLDSGQTSTASAS
jgi:serine/threonine-protein kinase